MTYGFRFQEWAVYKDARAFRVEILKILKTFPKEEQYVLIDQAKRASLSIILNIAESANKNTDKDMRVYINRSQGSLDEIVACFDCASDQGYITENQYEQIIQKANNLAKQLSGFSFHLSKQSNQMLKVKSPAFVETSAGKQKLRVSNNSMLKVKSQKLMVNNSGFSALEMLLVMAIIVLILGAGVIVGFRDQPAKNRNTERRNEVSAIKDALTQWSLDTGTYMPAGTPALTTCIGTKTTAPACFDLLFLTPQYLAQIPEDPKNTNGQSDTGYTIYKNTANEIIISAPKAELGETIETRRK